jgi:hypothetical protein
MWLVISDQLDHSSLLARRGSAHYHCLALFQDI